MSEQEQTEYDDEADHEFVATIGQLSTEAMFEVEGDIERGGKGLDAEGHPFFTGTEICLARIIQSVREYAGARGLRLNAAIEDLKT